jgi:hypothetical protein
MASTRTSQQPADLVRLVKPVVRRWMNYYGRFNRWKCAQALGHVSEVLARWARRKFKQPCGCGNPGDGAQKWGPYAPLMLVMTKHVHRHCFLRRCLAQPPMPIFGVLRRSQAYSRAAEPIECPTVGALDVAAVALVLHQQAIKS